MAVGVAAASCDARLVMARRGDGRRMRHHRGGAGIAHDGIFENVYIGVFGVPTA